MIRIRPVKPEDAPRLLDIYSYYVTDTAISFEYEPPTEEEFRGRITHTLEKYPYLAAEEDGRILGYTYAGPLNVRKAYDHCCETTIYVDKDCRKQGLGRMLYEALEAELGKMGVTNLYACIGYPCEAEDQYLTYNSPDFHAHMGYAINGRFHRCGWKFGRWYDMIWMEKINVLQTP